MLTGVEIAGLLLAVLPLFIAAAKPYREGLEIMSTALRSKAMYEKLKDFYEELNYEVTLLRFTLENLVQSLPVITEEEKDRLINRFDIRLFDEEILALAFNERLGRAYDMFESYLRQILRLLEKTVDDETLQRKSDKAVRCSRLY